jgi:subtilase family serine protease
LDVDGVHRPGNFVSISWPDVPFGHVTHRNPNRQHWGMDMKPSKMMTTTSLVAILLASAGGAAAAASTPLAGHVAKWVAKASKVGTADASQTVKLSAFLGFRNHDELSRLIAAQSTPGAPEYNHYLTAAQFRAQFAPSARDEAKVEDGLRALGFAVSGKPASNLYVEFTGTVAQVKTAFGVSQDLYSYSGKVMRANAEQPRLPASLSGLVAAIDGLDESGLLVHPFHRTIADEDAAGAATTAAAAGPAATLPVAANLPSPYCSTYFGDTVATLSTQPSPYPDQVPWLVCGYSPQQMRAAYGADKSTLDGSGITVAYVDAYKSPTLLSDANRYAKNHGLPKLKSGSNFQEIYGGDLAKVPNGDPCGPQGWFLEISLDIDAIHTMAPGANVLYSGGLSCSNVDLDAALYTVIDGTSTVGGPLADIVSNSYGFTGEPLSQAEEAVETAIFEQAAVEGVSVLFSSGDNGDVALVQGIAEASWPAASPLVTAVGGTSLALKDSTGTKSEWGWGTFRAYLSGAMVNSATSVTDTGVGSYVFYSGAGGGPSFHWAEPSYQVGVVPTVLTKRTFDLNGKHYNLPGDRVAPDVAMDADPYTGALYGETYLIAGNPVSDAGCTPISATTEYCEEDIGGTSLASPLFAGTLALVDQLRHANGLGDLGFANPRLYGLKPGAPGSTTALVDVQAPVAPSAVLRGYVNDLTRVRVVTMNSVPGPFGPLCLTSFCNGQDSWILQTKPKYDDVTGVGAPYVPALLVSLGMQP